MSERPGSPGVSRACRSRGSGSSAGRPARLRRAARRPWDGLEVGGDVGRRKQAETETTVGDRDDDQHRAGQEAPPEAGRLSDLDVVRRPAAPAPIATASRRAGASGLGRTTVCSVAGGSGTGGDGSRVSLGVRLLGGLGLVGVGVAVGTGSSAARPRRARPSSATGSASGSRVRRSGSSGASSLSAPSAAPRPPPSARPPPPCSTRRFRRAGGLDGPAPATRRSRRRPSGPRAARRPASSVLGASVSSASSAARPRISRSISASIRANSSVRPSRPSPRVVGGAGRPRRSSVVSSRSSLIAGLPFIAAGRARAKSQSVRR